MKTIPMPTAGIASVAIYVFLMPVGSTVGLACVCSNGVRPPSELVFVGRVVSEKKNLLGSPIYTFSVQQIERGSAGETVNVHTLASDCGVVFEVNTVYRVFAERFESSGDLFFTSLCSGNELLKTPLEEEQDKTE